MAVGCTRHQPLPGNSSFNSGKSLHTRMIDRGASRGNNQVGSFPVLRTQNRESNANSMLSAIPGEPLSPGAMDVASGEPMLPRAVEVFVGV